jgi:CheY-like chemotaxis protein
MPKKILLADDSITIQKVVELTFSDGDYEVTAVNNGARAVQKLAEMRPDIILSDIIMPEKNGYEVCEFVKSHPEYRNIPVVLLTGTFEPFDPDRADKAGCDAVVTKPFESQSLIHKVEELIEQSRANAAAAPPPPPAMAAAPPPPPPPPAPSQFAPQQPSPWLDDTPPPPPPPADPGRSTGPYTHPNEIFSGSSASSKPTSELPFASGLETGAIPAGETRAFPKMSFDSFNMPAPDTAPQPSAPVNDDSPFGAPPPAEEFSGETRAFPTIKFSDTPQSLPPAGDDETPSSAPSTSSLWDEQPPAFSGETRAFPRVTFDQFQQPETPSVPWSSTPEASSDDEEDRSVPASMPFSEPAGAFGASSTDLSEPASEPAWSSAPPPPPPAAPVESSGNGAGGQLTDEQIDKIARRVVQLMSDQVVRNIAWEVIPDLAEIVVKERIRQLEAE